MSNNYQDSSNLHLTSLANTERLKTDFNNDNNVWKNVINGVNVSVIKDDLSEINDDAINDTSFIDNKNNNNNNDNDNVKSIKTDFVNTDNQNMDNNKWMSMKWKTFTIKDKSVNNK